MDSITRNYDQKKDFYITLGNELKRQRIEKKITQNDLSNLLGVSQVLISMFENGIRCVSLYQFYLLNQKYGFCLDINKLSIKRKTVQ